MNARGRTVIDRRAANHRDNVVNVQKKGANKRNRVGKTPNNDTSQLGRGATALIATATIPSPALKARAANNPCLVEKVAGNGVVAAVEDVGAGRTIEVRAIVARFIVAVENKIASANGTMNGN